MLTQRGIVSLECKVIGVPTPKLRWYKDDKEIKAGDIFALTANSEQDCLGIYTCEATNVMGTALSTSKIQVTHTPLDGNRDADRYAVTTRLYTNNNILYITNTQSPELYISQRAYRDFCIHIANLQSYS